MPLIAPPTAKALGQKAVVILADAPAAADGIPTLTEINAGIFASLHFYGDFNVTPTQDTGAGPRKMGSQVTPTQLGTITYPAVSASYSIVPQKLGTPGSPGNEVYEALVPGEQRTVVILDGLDGEQTTGASADDVADIYLMECGIRAKGQTGDGDYDEKQATSQMVLVGGEPLATDLALSA